MEKLEAKHTPIIGQVRIEQNFKNSTYYICDERSVIGTAIDEEIAAVIERSVNSHWELLEAAKQAAELLASGDTDRLIIHGESIWWNLKNAIAKAEGRS